MYLRLCQRDNCGWKSVLPTGEAYLRTTLLAWAEPAQGCSFEVNTHSGAPSSTQLNLPSTTSTFIPPSATTSPATSKTGDSTALRPHPFVAAVLGLWAFMV